MSWSDQRGDSGIDILPRHSQDSHQPSKTAQPPRRPVRRSVNRPESGVYGFFDQPTRQALVAGELHSQSSRKLSLASLNEESSPDWEFAIEEDSPQDDDVGIGASTIVASTAAVAADDGSTSLKQAQAVSAQRTLHQPSSRQSTPSPSFTFVSSRNAPPTDATLPTPDKSSFSFVQGHASPRGDPQSPRQSPIPAAPAYHASVPAPDASVASIPPPAAFACTTPPPAQAIPPRLSTAERLDRQRQGPPFVHPTDPDAIVSRRGTVVGRKGAIQDIRARFANPRPSSLPELASPSQLVDNGDSISSRRGSVLFKKGTVGRAMGMFRKKARDLTTPKSLADILAEKEAAAGAKTGGKLVIYTTSGTTVRATYANCQLILRILQGHRCKFEERDVMLAKAFANEVKERCPGGACLPQLFHNGKLLGGAAIIEKMNENGTLPNVLRKVPKYEVGEGPCDTCAGRYFIPCEWCGGDRKSVMSRFGTEVVKLKCTVCNEQGLQKCPECQHAQALEEASEA